MQKVRYHYDTSDNGCFHQSKKKNAIEQITLRIITFNLGQYR
jgi:hypothetical protein